MLAHKQSDSPVQRRMLLLSHIVHLKNNIALLDTILLHYHKLDVSQHSNLQQLFLVAPLQTEH